MLKLDSCGHWNCLGNDKKKKVGEGSSSTRFPFFWYKGHSTLTLSPSQAWLAGSKLLTPLWKHLSLLSDAVPVCIAGRECGHRAPRKSLEEQRETCVRCLCPRPACASPPSCKPSILLLLNINHRARGGNDGGSHERQQGWKQQAQLELPWG